MRNAMHRQALRIAAAIAVVLASALAATLALAQTPEPQTPELQAAGRIDLASAALGGRVESATDYIQWEEWSPVNLITANAPSEWGWSATQVTMPPVRTPIEALPDVGQVFGRDPLACIAYLELHSAIPRSGAEHDDTAGRSVADRVADQVGKDLLQAALIGARLG